MTQLHSLTSLISTAMVNIHVPVALCLLPRVVFLPDVADLLIYRFISPLFLFFCFCCGCVGYVVRMFCFSSVITVFLLLIFPFLLCCSSQARTGYFILKTNLMHYGVLLSDFLSRSPALCSSTRLRSDSVCRWKHKHSVGVQLRCLFAAIS